MIRIKKILYPTDFSSYSNQAYFHALALAVTHNASLTALFVYTPDAPIPGAPTEPNKARPYWQSQLEQIRPLDDRINMHHVVLEGDPAEEIVRYSREAGMDLVVMGTHGRTGIDRSLLGSVAERVLRDAGCSVLVAKLPGSRLVGTVRPDVQVVSR
jgi:nucleotide-binding universal stress UspA family protein